MWTELLIFGAWAGGIYYWFHRSSKREENAAFTRRMGKIAEKREHETPTPVGKVAPKKEKKK